MNHNNDIREKRKLRQYRTKESFNAEMIMGVNLTDEVKYHRQKLKQCLEEHADALDETEIMNASNLNRRQREWLLNLFQSAKTFLNTIDDDCISIIETSKNRKDRLDDALSQNAQLEKLNAELQAN